MDTIKVEQKLKPFRVPNYVVAEQRPRSRQEGFVEGAKYELGELSEEVLQRLCDQFREDVMKRAEEQRENATAQRWAP